MPTVNSHAQQIPPVVQPSEGFPALRNPPIAEAVLEFRAQPTADWNQERIVEILKERLPDFPELEPQRIVEQQFHAEIGKLPQHSTRDLGWLGVMLTSADKLRRAQFQRQGLIYNRLQPYPGWAAFSDEAIQLWRLFRDVAAPSEIARIGLRYINRIELDSRHFDLKDYFREPPQSPQGVTIPFASFFHQELFSDPASEYSIRLLRTIQSSGDDAAFPSLIVDIDVFTNRPIVDVRGMMSIRLDEMRWWKNKFFFATISDTLRERLA